MSHLLERPDGSIRLVADRRIYPRALVKQAAAVASQWCHVQLDLAEGGDVAVTFSPAPGQAGGDAVRDAAGAFGNLLLAELVRDRLDAQELAGRNLLLARALDGALPGPGDGGGAGGPGGGDEG